MAINPLIVPILKKTGIVCGVFVAGFCVGAHLRGVHADAQISKIRESIAVEAQLAAEKNVEVQKDYARRLSEAIEERDRAMADADEFKRQFVSVVERMRDEADAVSRVSVPGTAPSTSRALVDRNSRLAELQARGSRLREESTRLLQRAEEIASRSQSRADALAKIVSGGQSKGSQGEVGRHD